MRWYRISFLEVSFFHKKDTSKKSATLTCSVSYLVYCGGAICWFAQQPRARKDAPAMMHQKIHLELPERDLVRQARAARDAAELATATMTCSSLVGPVCMQSAHLSAMSERYERVFKPAVDDKRTRTVNTVRAAHKPTSQTSILRWADEETLTRVKDGRLGDVLVLFYMAKPSPVTLEFK